MSFPLAQLVDQLVQVAHLPQKGVLDLLHPDAAHRAPDQEPGVIQVGGLPEKVAVGDGPSQPARPGPRGNSL